MIKIFKINNKKSVVNVSKCNEHPEWMLKIKNDRIYHINLKNILQKDHNRLPVCIKLMD